MKPAIYIAAMLAISATAMDVQTMSATHLIGTAPGVDTWSFIDANGDGVRDGVAGAAITLTEIDAHALTPEFSAYTQSLAQVEADLAALPAPMPSGIAIPDEAGHYFEPVPFNGTFLAAQVSDSPLTSAVRRAAGIAAAQQHDRDQRADLRAIRGSVSTNVADVRAVTVTPTSTTAQVRSAVIDLRRELIDIAQDLQSLRAWQAKQIREPAP